MKPIEILDKILDLTNELSENTKAPNEYLAVNEIELAVGSARTVFDQRLEQKENKNESRGLD